jgi:hypothetical protein
VVPDGQVAEEPLTTLPVDDTLTTPGIPPGASYRPKASNTSSPGVVSVPWDSTRPPAPIRALSLPAAATITVPLLRA